MWNFSYPKLTIEFDKLPPLGDEVEILTREGIFKAKFTKYDWSDTNEVGYFTVEGKEYKNVIAWKKKETHDTDTKKNR